MQDLHIIFPGSKVRVDCIMRTCALLCSLASALYACRDRTGEIRQILTSATFSPRLPGATCYSRSLASFPHQQRAPEPIAASPGLISYEEFWALRGPLSKKRI